MGSLNVLVDILGLDGAGSFKDDSPTLPVVGGKRKEESLLQDRVSLILRDVKVGKVLWT